MNSQSIYIDEDPNHAADHAVIRVVGGAASRGKARLRIKRPGGQFLGPAGWQNGEVWLDPDAIQADGHDLVVYVGPGVCREMRTGNYEFSVGDVVSVEVWPSIRSGFGGQAGVFGRRPDVPEPDVTDSAVRRRVAPQVVPEVVPDPDPEPEKLELPKDDPIRTPLLDGGRKDSPVPPPKPVTLWVALAAVIILAAVGGTIWYLRHPTPIDLHSVAPSPACGTDGAAACPRPVPQPIPCGGATPNCAPPIVPPPPPPPPPPVPPTTAFHDLKPFEFLKRFPRPEDIVPEAQWRLDNGHASDGFLLMFQAALRGSAAAKARLARIYDPTLPAIAGVDKNLSEAARNYKEAEMAGDRSVTSDRHNFCQHLDELAGQHDHAATVARDSYCR